MTTWNLSELCTCGLSKQPCKRHIYKKEVIEMTSLEQANELNNAIPRWDSTMTDVEKAKEVLRWCREVNIKSQWNANSLASGMGHFPYWNQGPADYLCLVLAVQELTPLELEEALSIAVVAAAKELPSGMAEMVWDKFNELMRKARIEKPSEEGLGN